MIRVTWSPPLVDEPPPKFGAQRFARLNRLVKHFARLHQRRPLHVNIVHDGKRVQRVELENLMVDDLNTPIKKTAVMSNGLERKTPR
jgi:hypothetical protein